MSKNNSDESKGASEKVATIEKEKDQKVPGETIPRGLDILPENPTVKKEESSIVATDQNLSTDLAKAGSLYAQRIKSILSSDVMEEVRSLLKKDQHYVIFKGRDGSDQKTLTRDGWNIVASLFGIKILIVEEETKEIYDTPGEYAILKDSYERNFDKWIAGDLPAEAGKKLKDIIDRLSNISAMEVRPTKKFAIGFKVRAEFTQINENDPVYYREEVARDIVTPGDYRIEYFKLLTRVCNRAVRNLTGGLLGGDVVGSDEELEEANSRNPK